MLQKKKSKFCNTQKNNISDIIIQSLYDFPRVILKIPDIFENFLLYLEKLHTRQNFIEIFLIIIFSLNFDFIL